jgi:hypothetical protein
MRNIMRFLSMNSSNFVLRIVLRICWELVLKCFGLTEDKGISVMHERAQVSVNSTGVLFIYL